MNRTDSFRAARRPIGVLLALLFGSASLSAQTPADTVDIALVPACWVADETASDAFAALTNDGEVTEPITVRLRIGGTATVGEDHLLGDTTVVLEPQGFGAFITVSLRDDARAEGIETIEISASVESGPGRIADTTPSRIYLLDDETPPTNLLVNPGFESGLTGWIATDDNVAANVMPGRTGERALAIEASADDTPGIALQDVAVVPGALYLFVASLQSSGIDMPGVAAQLIWLDAAGEEIERHPIFLVTAFDPPGWSTSSGCDVAPPNTVTARFQLSIPEEEDDDGAVWFDDLGLYPFAETTDVKEGRVGAPLLDLSMRGE